MNCPKCTKPLKQRKGKFGEFWGCTGYPNCKYTFTEVKGGYPQPAIEQSLKSPIENEKQDASLIILEEIQAINKRLNNMAEFLVEKLGSDKKPDVSVKDIQF